MLLFSTSLRPLNHPKNLRLTGYRRIVYRTPVAPVLFALALLLATPIRGQQNAPDGTYDVWICKESCEMPYDSSAVVSGQFILSDTINRATIPEDVRDYLRKYGLLIRQKGGMNACFILERHTRFAGTFAGIVPVALTRWEAYQAAEDDTLDADFSITLYASPDAFSTFFFNVEGPVLDGVGRSSGFIGEPFAGHDGYLVGRRIGAADLNRCWQAARARKRPGPRR